MESRNYKVTLSVDFNKEINLVNELDDIIDAAHDFTQKNNDKTINLCDVGREKIEMLVVIHSNKKCNNFTARSIIGFLRRICRIYDLEYSSKIITSQSMNFQLYRKRIMLM